MPPGKTLELVEEIMIFQVYLKGVIFSCARNPPLGNNLWVDYLEPHPLKGKYKELQIITLYKEEIKKSYTF